MKRYEMVGVPHVPSHMTIVSPQESDKGEWVKYEDFAEFVRRAREIRGGGQDANGPLCVVRFYADAIGLIRDLAAENLPDAPEEGK